MTDDKPSGTTSDPEASHTTRTWLNGRNGMLVGAAVFIIAVVVVVVLALSAAGGDPSASPVTDKSSTPATSTPPSGEPTASPTASPDPTTEPTLPATTTPIDKPAEILPSLSAAIASITAVQGEASGPGEVAGPSIRFVVNIDNQTAKSADLTNMVVSVFYGTDLTPAAQLSGPGQVIMPGSVAAGSTASGTYIFSVPIEERGNVRIVIDFSVDVDPLVFQGAVPTA